MNSQILTTAWQLLFDDDDDDIELIAAHATLQNCLRIARRKRAYLTRTALCPNPRINTPWQFLYHSQDNRAFINTMGVDCTVFQYILDAGFEELWNTTPIYRGDNRSEEVRLGARALNAAGGLGIISTLQVG